MRGRVADESSGMMTARGAPHMTARHDSGLIEVTTLQAQHSMRVRHDGTETRSHQEHLTTHGRSTHQRGGRRRWRWRVAESISGSFLNQNDVIMKGVFYLMVTFTFKTRLHWLQRDLLQHQSYIRNHFHSGSGYSSDAGSATEGENVCVWMN